MSHPTNNRHDNTNQDKDPTNINLSDLNKPKTKKTLPKLTNPFKKQTGPHRDDEGKFATKSTTGSGGLTAVKHFNWKRAAPLMAIITIVGGLFVYQSFAATFQTRGKLTTGKGVNCRTWGKTNGVPVEFYAAGSKSNVSGSMHARPWIEWAYQAIHNEFPTVNEKLHWIARANELHEQFKGDPNRQACGITWEVYNEIKNVTPEGRTILENDQASKGDDVLMTIYAAGIIPDGSLSNSYLMDTIHHDSGIAHTIARPTNTKILKPIPSSWPEKIKVCAIVYNWRESTWKTTAKLSAKTTQVASSVKTPVLEELPNLNQKYPFRPKHEICSDPLLTKITDKRTNKTTYAKYVGAEMDMVKLEALSQKAVVKQGRSIPDQYRVMRDFRSYTNPNSYTVRFEQWVIKKAE